MENLELEPLVRADKVATLLDLTDDAVYRMAREGRLPSVRLGRRVLRFRLREILEFIEERTRQAGGAK